MIVFISYTVSLLIHDIHRPKLRSSPNLGQLTEHHASVYLYIDRRPSPSMITFTSHLNTWCDGGVLTLCVPVAFRNKCERVTGPQPEPVRSIFAGVEWDRNGTGTRTGTGVNTALMHDCSCRCRQRLPIRRIVGLGSPFASVCFVIAPPTQGASII